MRQEVIERIKSNIEYEFERPGLADGFPTLPDVPAGRYTDPRFFALEMERMWPRTWLYAGRAEQLPNRGDFQVWDYSGPSIVLLRDGAGRARAFLNESPNGAPLVPCQDVDDLIHEAPFDAPGQLFIQLKFPRRELPKGLLRCQRKGWTYDLDGRLVGVPKGQVMDSVPHKQRQLTEFRCEEWDGFIFVNRDPDAQPLLEWLGPVAEQMAQFNSASLRMYSRATVLLRTNWKVAVEAFQEVYHFKHIHHSEGVVGLDQRGVVHTNFPNGQSRMVTPYAKRAQLLMGMDGPTDWRDRPPQAASLIATGLPPIPTVLPIVKNAVLTYSLFPNITFPTNQMGFPFLAAWPVDEAHTLFEWTTFTPDWGDDDGPLITAMREATLTTPMTIMEEDTRNMEPMFMSLSSPGLPGIHMGYNERRLYYAAEYLDRVIGPERIPEHLRVEPLLETFVEAE